MKLRSGSILGLALSDRRILCALVATHNGGASVQKLLSFEFPEGLTSDKPAELGAAFAQFLREHHVNASRAVAGVPAKWLISQEREVPPSTREQALGMLRLQAERLTVADHADLVFDYVGEFGSQVSRVLLVGILKKRIDQLSAFGDAAGLTLAGVTSTALAAASALKDQTNGALLMLDDNGAEMTSPVLLRHLGAGKGAAVGAEAKRTLTMSAPVAGSMKSLMVWDGLGLSELEMSDLSTRAGVKVQHAKSLDAISADLQPAALNGGAESRSPVAFLPAVAVAACALRNSLPADFLDSRLAVQQSNRVSKPVMWAAIIATVAVVGAVVLYTTVQQRESEVAELTTKLKELDPKIKSARATVDRFRYLRTYFETRPSYLSCLREMSQAFNYNEQIWLSSLTLRDAQKGQMQGKTTDQKLVLSLLDRLKANGKFSQVQLLDLRESTGRSREISFSITFTYVGVN